MAPVWPCTVTILRAVTMVDPAGSSEAKSSGAGGSGLCDSGCCGSGRGRGDAGAGAARREARSSCSSSATRVLDAASRVARLRTSASSCSMRSRAESWAWVRASSRASRPESWACAAGIDKRRLCGYSLNSVFKRSIVWVIVRPSAKRSRMWRQTSSASGCRRTGLPSRATGKKPGNLLR
ncbi:MAG: hypothetical protein CVU73_15620 [Deltaproteobacteria bacterium HGW-Deltaproteobacteria-8]|nr:MAG: hypothetical protein CVU73_15620 [Deltaproteobacteria bacterium HGW-Deltaproteobacteria-8]